MLAGWGRTNLREYFNLNFDPNDSWLLGASWKPDDSTAVTVFQVRDDRLDTRQRVTHLVARVPGTAGYKWSFDLFTRLVWDPRANFGPTSMLRWSVGMRF